MKYNKKICIFVSTMVFFSASDSLHAQYYIKKWIESNGKIKVLDGKKEKLIPTPAIPSSGFPANLTDDLLNFSIMVNGNNYIVGIDQVGNFTEDNFKEINSGCRKKDGKSTTIGTPGMGECR